MWGVKLHLLHILKDTDLYLITEPGHKFLLPEMLSYAEKELSIAKESKRILTVWITDKEADKKELLAKNGYRKVYSYPVKIFCYDKPFLKIKLPDGFSFISLEDENDCKNQ